MFGIHTKAELKYLKAEIFFLVFMCYLSSIIGSMEYGYTAKSDVWFFTSQLEINLLYGTFGFAFFGIYYWCFLKRFVFERKTFYLLFSIIILAITYGFYSTYVVNWIIFKLPFVSLKYRQMAQVQLEQKNWGVYITPLLTSRLMVIIGFAYLIHSLQQTEQVKALRQEKLSAELTYLKSRLQPHFFFNTLNNIYSLAMQQSEITGPMVSRLAEMMRYIIYESEQETVPLSKEIAFLQNYVEIEKMRYRESTSIRLDVEYLDPDWPIEPLLLLPLVENAFKHGLQDEVGEGYVDIIFYMLNSELVFNVVNSIPEASDTGNKVGGMGLLNLRKRLELIYPGQHELKIQKSEQFYKVNLILNMK